MSEREELMSNLEQISQLLDRVNENLESLARLEFVPNALPQHMADRSMSCPNKLKDISQDKSSAW